MKKNVMFLALAAIGLASCNGGFKQGESGILYNIHKDNGGPKIKEGDFVLANLVIKNDADSVLLSTYDQGRPTPLILPKPQFPGDIFDAFKLFAEGDSATVKLAADSIFKKQPKPPGFKGKYLLYEVKIVKLIPKGKSTDPEFQATITKYMSGLTDELKKQEPGRLKKYIDDNKLNVSKTDSGLYYVITKPGAGPLIANNDTAVINYTGKLLNGKVFDSSIKEVAYKAKLGSLDQRPYTPIRVAVGQRKVIPGWDQGLLLLNKGAKATLIIPSSLGYGAAGAGPIPAYSPIIFEMEIVDVKHPNPNAVVPAPPTMMAPTAPVKK